MAENKMPISHTTRWELQQRRQWPPPPYQAYCTRHFIQECLVYYSLERQKFEAKEGRLKMSKVIHQNVKNTERKPSRVQPSRKAKGGTGAATQLEGTIEERKAQLQLHHTWPTFKAHLEVIIGVKLQGEEAQSMSNMDDEASMSNDDRKNYLRHPSCPFQGHMPPNCRYCHHNLLTAPLHGKSPEHRVPMAPMHPVGLDYIEDQPIHTFGGLRFAVDACGDEKVIVLIDLDTRKSEAGLGQQMAAVKRNKDQLSKRMRRAT